MTAVMLIALSLIAAGAETNAAGFGVGGLVSGVACVVAFEGAEAVPVFGTLSRICTV